MNEDKKYASLLDFLKENEEKLKVFLSADEKMKGYRYNLKGKKTSRTIFLSQSLQFLMNEFCIENGYKIGEFAELAIIEHLCRSGYEEKLKSILTSSDEGKKGKNPKHKVEKGKGTGEYIGEQIEESPLS